LIDLAEGDQVQTNEAAQERKLKLEPVQYNGSLQQASVNVAAAANKAFLTMCGRRPWQASCPLAWLFECLELELKGLFLIGLVGEWEAPERKRGGGGAHDATARQGGNDPDRCSGCHVGSSTQPNRDPSLNVLVSRLPTPRCTGAISTNLHLYPF